MEAISTHVHKCMIHTVYLPHVAILARKLIPYLVKHLFD